MSALKFRLGAGAAALSAVLAVSAAHAQSATYDTIHAAISSFANRYGTNIVVRGAIDQRAPVAVSAFASGTAGREQAVQLLADAAGTKWHRIYFVSAASAGNPVTTLAAAKKLTTNRGPVSFSINGLSSEAAVKAIAAADGAEASIQPSFNNKTLTLSANSLNVPAAIAEVAQRTNAHWTIGYVLGTGSNDTSALARAQRRDEINRLEANQVGNSNGPTGPITVHFAPTPPATANTQNQNTAVAASDALQTPDYSNYGYSAFGTDPAISAYQNSIGPGTSVTTPPSGFSVNPFTFGSPFGYGAPYGGTAYTANGGGFAVLP